MSKKLTPEEAALKFLLDTGVLTQKEYNEKIAALNTTKIDESIKTKALQPLKKISEAPKEIDCKKYIILNGKEYCFKNRQELSKKINVPVKDLSAYFNEGLRRVVIIGDNIFMIDIRNNNKQLLEANGYTLKRPISNNAFINGLVSDKISILKLSSPLLKNTLSDDGTVKIDNDYMRGYFKRLDQSYVYDPRDFWTNKTIQKFNEVRVALKPERRILEHKNVIIQDPPSKFSLSYLARKFFREDGTIANPNLRFFNENDNFLVYIDLMHKKLYSIKYLRRAFIQIIYYSYNPDAYDRHSKKPEKRDKTLEDIGEIFHTKPASEFFKDSDPFNLKYTIASQGSGFQTVILGYRVAYSTSNNRDLTLSDLKMLKAFKDCNDRKFMELTCGSSKGSGICIYESFLDIIGVRDLRYKHNTDKNNEKILKKLEKEGKIISDAVKKGLLYKSLELLTKKYECEIVLIYYGTLMYNNEGKYDSMGVDEKPTITKNGETMIIEDLDFLKDYDGKKIMLYQKDIHVAPSIFRAKKERDNTIHNSNLNKIDDLDGISRLKKSKFVLEPEIITDKKNDKKKPIKNILGYDFETFTRKPDNVAVTFCCCIYGMLKGKEVKKSFYGVGCKKAFAEYINSISITYTRDKSGDLVPSKYQDPVYIYGFNNRNFDNLLIWEALHDLNPSMEQIISGNSIKYIKFNRLKIMDISSYYSLGTLRKTAKSFKLEEAKGYYPYTFPHYGNLNYIGPIPDKKYWVGNDYHDYLELNLNNFDEKSYVEGKYDDKFLKKTSFDLKEYTIKYCLLDCKLVYDMAIIHLENCRGLIKRKDFEPVKRYDEEGGFEEDFGFRNYDVSSCVTSAGISLRMFKQCFLDEPLYQSPDNIIACEALAYKGGRTEVFKTNFSASKKYPVIFYIDINSSYPASMTKEMPLNFIDKLDHNDLKVLISDIVPTNAYLASVFYNGKNKNFIPNILTRDPKTKNIIACKDSYKSYQWGCELIEAIKNDCEVIIHEEIRYEKGFIFKEFIEYFYEERLKCKHTNPCKAQFIKTVMNSLYGKFGQKCFDITKIFNCMESVFEYLDSDNVILKDFQICHDKILAEFSAFCKEYQNIGKLMRFSSYIAALSRCNLSEVMRDIGHEHIYYCDTDSVFTTKMPSSKYISQDKLGLWKLEGRAIRKAIFIAPKMYYYVEDELSSKEIEETLEDFKYDEKLDDAENEKKLLNLLESQIHTGKRAKGIKAENLLEEDYDNLNTGSIKEKSQQNTMFIRSFNNVKIVDMIRRVKPVLNKRIWNDNDSEAFQNIEEWRKSIVQ